MANFYHYLSWRGEIPLDRMPLNEVDSLILAWLAYADLREVMPDTPDTAGTAIKDMAKQYFQTHAHHGKVNLLDSLNPPLTATVLLDRLAACERFCDIKATYLADRIDYENPTQFAAMTFILPEETLFIAYRGTDRTFVGWKEDFYISCMDEIPSQRDALAYLVSVAKAFPHHKLILGGHSKGGNLAAYAAINAPDEIKLRIDACYNHDGPGFSDSLLASEGYQKIRNRIHKYVPHGSIVGILFDNERDFNIITSAQVGFLQHNGPCWEVLGSRFVRAECIVKSAEVFDENLRAWLNAQDEKARRTFIDALFSIFEKSNIKTFDDIGNNKVKSLLSIAHALYEIEPETRGMMVKTFFGLFKMRSAILGAKAKREEAYSDSP